MTEFGDDKKRGITKIDLIVLVCVICLVIGMVSFAWIPLQEREHIKAKMTEVTYSMANVASAVTAYNQDLNSWPHCDGIIAIRNSLGLFFPTTDRISSITVTSPRAEEVIITATIKGIDSRVDGKNLTLTGKDRNVAFFGCGAEPCLLLMSQRNKSN